MNPSKKTARIAGALYVIMGAVGPFSLIYVPRKLIVSGDATATANKILASETLFRAGIAAELIGGIAFILLAVTLYRLLSGVNKTHASLMVIFALLSVPISFLNVVNDLAALILLRGPQFLSVFDKRQLDAMAMFFLRLHGQGLMVTEIFWGLWLFPFGLLVFRSGFLPRILGILLMINCFPYVFASLASVLALKTAFTALSPVAVALETGELWIMLWLLIRGVNEKALPRSPLEQAMATS